MFDVFSNAIMTNQITRQSLADASTLLLAGEQRVLTVLTAIAMKASSAHINMMIAAAVVFLLPLLASSLQFPGQRPMLASLTGAGGTAARRVVLSTLLSAPIVSTLAVNANAEAMKEQRKYQVSLLALK